jgi:hypothetical protein
MKKDRTFRVVIDYDISGELIENGYGTVKGERKWLKCLMKNYFPEGANGSVERIK